MILARAVCGDDGLLVIIDRQQTFTRPYFYHWAWTWRMSCLSTPNRKMTTFGPWSKRWPIAPWRLSGPPSISWINATSDAGNWQPSVARRWDCCSDRPRSWGIRLGRRCNWKSAPTPILTGWSAILESPTRYQTVPKTGPAVLKTGPAAPKTGSCKSWPSVVWGGSNAPRCNWKSTTTTTLWSPASLGVPATTPAALQRPVVHQARRQRLGCCGHAHSRPANECSDRAAVDGTARTTFRSETRLMNRNSPHPLVRTYPLPAPAPVAHAAALS